MLCAAHFDSVWLYSEESDKKLVDCSNSQASFLGSDISTVQVNPLNIPSAIIIDFISSLITVQVITEST